MTVIPPIISVDDHVIEPPDLWRRRLPAGLRELGPRIVRAPYEMVRTDRQPFRRAASGPETDFWEYEGETNAIMSVMACAGKTDDEISLGPIRFDAMRPGCFDVAARLADMDVNHVERSLCFPTYPRFCGQTFLEAKDKHVALACVRAYNDWMVEEWAGESRGRLIPLCIIPLWDPVAAGDEVRRNAARGVRAVTFSELPQELGLPSLHDADRHWDPFLAACDETATVICVHIGSSSRTVRSSADAPGAAGYALTAINSIMSLTDWLLSGALVRFPGVRLAFSESQVGWMPYQIQRIDDVWRHHRGRSIAGVDHIPEPPSTYVEGRVFGCIVQDDFGIAVRGGSLGAAQLTFESDYPHTDSTWPDTKAYAEHALASYTQAEVDMVIRTNAIRLFGLLETLDIP
jgi:predicted TIM-barrel fold metal-dependent hydrolase